MGLPTPTPVLDALGRQVFEAPASQFIIVVEAAPGANGAAVGSSLGAVAPDGRPDLQIQSSVTLGNGSLTVCDKGPPPLGGGIPAINPPSFALGEPLVTDALLDFACRFDVHQRSSPCTVLDATGQPGYIEPAATLQFCNIVAATAALPPGDALLTVRVRDRGGELGPAREIVVRVTAP